MAQVFTLTLWIGSCVPFAQCPALSEPQWLYLAGYLQALGGQAMELSSGNPTGGAWAGAASFAPSRRPDSSPLAGPQPSWGLLPCPPPHPWVYLEPAVAQNSNDTEQNHSRQDAPGDDHGPGCHPPPSPSTACNTRHRPYHLSASSLPSKLF